MESQSLFAPHWTQVPMEQAGVPVRCVHCAFVVHASQLFVVTLQADAVALAQLVSSRQATQ